jgi:hypothetical protein
MGILPDVAGYYFFWPPIMVLHRIDHRDPKNVASRCTASLQEDHKIRGQDECYVRRYRIDFEKQNIRAN